MSQFDIRPQTAFQKMQQELKNPSINQPTMPTRETIELDEYKDTIKSLREGFRQIEEQELSSIMVKDYINNFLVLHLHIYNEAEDLTYNMWDWIDFAGSLYREVILLDNHGREIYRIPSILPKDAYVLYNTDKDEQGNDVMSSTLGQRLQNAKDLEYNYAERSRAMRTNIYNDILGRFSDDVIQAHRKRWADFLDFMGVGPNCKVEANQSGTIEFPKANNERIEDTQEDARSLFF